VKDSEPPQMTVSPERRLGQRLHAFSNMVSGHYYQRTEKPLGVALAEWRVLRAVLLSPGVSQSEVASNEGLNVMNVSRAVAGLRRKGLLDVQTDPADRRRTSLNATELGRGFGADIGSRESAMYEHLFSVLSPAELALLDELMSRVNDALRAADPPPPTPASRDWRSAIEAASSR